MPLSHPHTARSSQTTREGPQLPPEKVVRAGFGGIGCLLRIKSDEDHGVDLRHAELRTSSYTPVISSGAAYVDAWSIVVRLRGWMLSKKSLQQTGGILVQFEVISFLDGLRRPRTTQDKREGPGRAAPPVGSTSKWT